MFISSNFLINVFMAILLLSGGDFLGEGDFLLDENGLTAPLGKNLLIRVLRGFCFLIFFEIGIRADIYYMSSFFYAPNWVRTSDLQVNSLSLYLLSYRSQATSSRIGVAESGVRTHEHYVQTILSRPP
jgi:hypothetical protein